MKFRRFPLIAGLLASSLAFAANATGSVSAAVTPKPDDNACTWFRTIDNWQRLDDRNLIVWGPNKAAYHVELSMPPFDLNSAESIAFVDGNRDGQLCGGGRRSALARALRARVRGLLGVTARSVSAILAGGCWRVVSGLAAATVRLLPSVDRVRAEDE